MPVPLSETSFRPALVPRRRLAEVAAAAGYLQPVPDLVVTGLAQDSRRVRPGDLYVALAGARAHGADFAVEAAARGAVAMIGDRAATALPSLAPVPGLRAALGPLASWLHGHPSRALDVHGVTGTNGKSSTAHLIAAGLAGAGARPALLSGIVQRLPAASRGATLTTPEAVELQQLLAAAVEQGADAAAVEVSSHGLALHRVDGVRFRTAVFTNLGPDHLDLHGDMESYYAAKASLFDPSRCGLAVVNRDDAAGRRLAAEARVPVVTFSAAADARADWRAVDVVADARGTRFRALGPGTDVPVRLRLLGGHQVDNALGALAALVATGVDGREAALGMGVLAGVPGRLERVDAGQPFLALVDHVHNTSGQERLFGWLAGASVGRLHVVVGATGGRDPGKRGPLGRLAAVHADTVVVTDESAHDDDPAELREAVAAGARSAGGATVVVEPDRGRALDLAVAAAAPGDVVLVAGRGAAPALVGRGRRVPFDDRIALREALHRRARRGAPETRAG